MKGKTGSCLYLYCFSPAGGPLPLEEKGVDGENGLFSLSYRDLSALVSSVPLSEYNEEALHKSVQDVGWITPRVQRHEQIIERLMGLGPVLPVKFCTLFKNRKRVQEVLKANYQEFRSFLTYIRDKQEWGVKAYIDENGIEGLVQSTSPALQGLNDKISAASPGEGYFLKKKREGFMREEAGRLLDAVADEIYEKILSLTVRGRRNQLLSKQATGRAEEMFLNAAFLVKSAKVEEFKGGLDEMAAGYQSQGLVFELSGPWPPYNFCPAGQLRVG